MTIQIREWREERDQLGNVAQHYGRTISEGQCAEDGRELANVLTVAKRFAPCAVILDGEPVCFYA